jgi:putative chitinase
MAIDRAKFFSAARQKPFGGSFDQSEVDGLNAILDAWEALPPVDMRHLAYELGTAFHETAMTMQPIPEWGKGAGHPYGHPDPVTRKVYYGRGYVQLTWKANYETMSHIVGADLVNQPDLALEPDIAAKIMFEGMERGLFTGKKLSDYFTAEKSDWINARRIINGLDKAQAIALYSQEFMEALS